MIEYTVEINGIHVEATYSDETVTEIFLPLLNKLTVIQKKKGRRILVMLAAPPGAGKSTLCSFLEYLSKEHDDIGDIQAILRGRLIDRKKKSGNDIETATRFVDFSDMANVRLCLEKSMEADLMLQMSDNAEYVKTIM